MISLQDFPKDYLTGPQLDAYRTELETLNGRKRRLKKFETMKVSAATEKFFRLYFYQGLDQVDRLVVHTEFLELKSKKFKGVALTLVVGATSLFVTNRSSRFAPFLSARVLISGMLGYFTYFNYRAYSLYTMEKVVEPLYEKYRIK